MKMRIRASGWYPFYDSLLGHDRLGSGGGGNPQKDHPQGRIAVGESHRNSIALAYFAKRLEDLSKGDMTMKIFYAGSIVKGPTEIDSIKNGIVDVGTVTLPYHPGAIPESVRIAVMVPFVSDFDSWLWLAKNTDWFRGFLTKLNLQPLYYAHAELVFTMVSPIEDLKNRV